MAQPLVWVNDLTFRYRERPEPALREISFEAQAGELLLIAGASGCGKTTLIRCLNGLIPRSYKGELQGEILLDGKSIANLPLARISQMVGTVLQDPERQILGTRVRNEVAFGLENLALPREEIIQRIDEALTYLGIHHLRDRETFNLSGGEKQKVALAGVLAMRPKILLLDEPLASLDPASAQETLRIVRQMVDEGLCVLMVEHRVEDVLKIHPDRVLLMEGGQIRYLGDVEGLYQVVNYREIKLPASEVLKRARHDPAPPLLQVLPSVQADTKTSEQAPLVRFEQVCFGYETKPNVLQDVNFEIRRGDVIAVLGANGAGKTTLVKHAIGLLKPTSGRVLINGVDTRHLSVAEIARTLGYVFQSPSHMLFAPTVYDELAFGPRNLEHPKDQIEKEVMEALEIVNLSGREKDPPLSLSFGQQKRVSIAAVLAMRSRILIMDEPTAGQDYQNYMDFMDAIIQLPNIEAILFITHDIDLAIIYANRVALMSEGRLVADGKPQDVLKDLERLRDWRLVPTSLLQLNLEMLPTSGKFLRAEALAHLPSLKS
ncbi:MAG: ABC transporter ATP-binding protein [Anaerolineae bacterium]|jgi:energy-coupling factor transport system ATP-binding protein|nr:MAG: ABC transporter ATP-binding protein [Anaerolineae bacterium]